MKRSKPSPDTAGRRSTAVDVVSVVGARPQFVKAAELGRALVDRGLSDLLVHTGQHYDHRMSGRLFQELDLREPDVNLRIGSGSHGEQTGKMLTALESVLQPLPGPPVVVLYGDTNSTLAGAICAAKLGMPIAHVEAGLRSYRKHMPEEINRVVCDSLATLLFCPTPTAVANLAAEGITQGVFVTGDVMCDAVLRQLPKALTTALGRHLQGALHKGAEAPDGAREPVLGLDVNQTVSSEWPTGIPLPSPGGYRIATIHRASNTDDPLVLGTLLEAIADPACPAYLPLHPRTRDRIDAFGLDVGGQGLFLIPPVSYLEMLALVSHARQVLTDSGGLQKEAMLLGTPCVTLRAETEWKETVELGWNVLCANDPGRIRDAMATPRPHGPPPKPYGDGTASIRIATHIEALLQTQYQSDL